MFKGNLAIVTGRSRLAAEYSLKSLIKYFNSDACVFLEDKSVSMRNQTLMPSSMR